MSAVWSTSWRILGISPQVTLLRQTAVSSAAIILANRVKSPLLAASFPKFLCIGPNASNYRLRIVGVQLNTQKRPGNPPSHHPQIWRAAISDSQPPSSELPEVSAANIREIFEGSLDQKRGNELLQILQHQRVSGTLDQEVSASPHAIIRALVWLRAAVPVDEDAAIIRRLDREEALEFENISHYVPQQSTEDAGTHGRSVLKEWKEHNERKTAQKKAAQQQKDQAKIDVKVKLTTPRPPTAISKREKNPRPEWVQRYWDAAVSQHKAPPTMTKLQRLWPSTAVTVVVVALSILFALNYRPPSRNVRLWPDLRPAAATVGTLIGINFLVFALWRVLPPAWKLLNKHFLVVPGVPHASALIGSIFSHQSFFHLVGNMGVLWIVGIRRQFTLVSHDIGLSCLTLNIVHDEIGRGSFLAVFFSTGVVAGYCSLSRYVLQSIFYTCSLGASGALTGVIGTWCWIRVYVDLFSFENFC